MQEIKFKYGYSDGTNLFEKVFTLSNIEQGLQFDEICDSPLMKDYKIVHRRQYTGLKDKNDVEIYEGDIVRKLSGNYKTGKVVFDFSMFCFHSIGAGIFKNSDAFIHIHSLHYDEYDKINIYTIIGNIYENPELLEDK